MLLHVRKMPSSCKLHIKVGPEGEAGQTIVARRHSSDDNRPVLVYDLTWFAGRSFDLWLGTRQSLDHSPSTWCVLDAAELVSFQGHVLRDLFSSRALEATLTSSDSVRHVDHSPPQHSPIKSPPTFSYRRSQGRAYGHTEYQVVRRGHRGQQHLLASFSTLEDAKSMVRRRSRHRGRRLHELEPSTLLAVSHPQHVQDREEPGAERDHGHVASVGEGSRRDAWHDVEWNATWRRVRVRPPHANDSHNVLWLLFRVRFEGWPDTNRF